jgi:stearoyl-CoA desaturase (delta-9 desaturase)
VTWVVLILGAGFQNSAVAWSADHWAHHADMDGDRAPHGNERILVCARGLVATARESSADVTQLGDLGAVRSIRLQHRCHLALAVGVGLVLRAAVAASWGDFWGGLLVAGSLRTAVTLQATFCVNSVAHLVGTKRYNNAVSARNSVLTALLTFGEGYHSFHPRFPFDYRKGVRWWPYDPGRWLIWWLARISLATKVHTAGGRSVASAAVRPR